MQAPSPPYRHGTRAEHLAHTLLVRIATGDLRPDQRLFYEELERDYAVSRTVVREALRILEGKLLVTARPHTGTCVAPRDAWNHFDPQLLAAQITHDAATRDDALDLLDAIAGIDASDNPLANRLRALLTAAHAAAIVSPEPAAA